MIHLLHHQVKTPGQRVAQKAAQVAAGATLRVHIANSTDEKASAAGENEGTKVVLPEHRC
jgi:hypothetical protein